MNASSRIVKQLQSELEIAVYARNGDDEKELRQPSCAVTCLDHGEKPEVAVNARNGDDEKELQQTSCAITCIECKKRLSSSKFNRHLVL